MDKIEQEFFEAFGIEPEIIYEYNFNLSNNPKYSTRAKYVVVNLCKQGYKVESVKIIKLYPPITPEIILELMQLIFDATLKKYPKTTGLNFDIKRDIKEQILSGCIQLQPEIQDQVRGLFNGK
jgi:hypothetical protein